MPLTMPGVRGFLHPDFEFPDQPEQAFLVSGVQPAEKPLPMPPVPRPAVPPKRYGYGILSDDQIANILFNESRALSGEGLDEMYKEFALTILKADDMLGTKRKRLAGTAPDFLPNNISPQERARLEQMRQAVAEARERFGRGEDPKGSAQFYGLPRTPPTGPRMKVQEIQSKFGPFWDQNKKTENYPTTYFDPTLKPR